MVPSRGSAAAGSDAERSLIYYRKLIWLFTWCHKPEMRSYGLKARKVQLHDIEAHRMQVHDTETIS